MKGLIPALLVVVAMLVAGCGDSETRTPTPTSAGWQTYTNDHFWYAIDYPASWTVGDSEQLEGFVVVHIKAPSTDVWVTIMAPVGAAPVKSEDFETVADEGLAGLADDFEDFRLLSKTSGTHEGYRVLDAEYTFKLQGAPTRSRQRSILWQGKHYIVVAAGFADVYDAHSSELDRVLDSFRFQEERAQQDRERVKQIFLDYVMENVIDEELTNFLEPLDKGMFSDAGWKFSKKMTSVAAWEVTTETPGSTFGKSIRYLYSLKYGAYPPFDMGEFLSPENSELSSEWIGKAMYSSWTVYPESGRVIPEDWEARYLVGQEEW